MRNQHCKSTLVRLGQLFHDLGAERAQPKLSDLGQEAYDKWLALVERTKHHNGWFTPQEIRRAMRAWAHALREEAVDKWLEENAVNEGQSKTIAIIMAGNIPMVGLHDLLSVYATGHKALVKLSSEDEQLMGEVISTLKNWDAKAEIEISRMKLVGFDAVIATGSNNTSRYFQQYFGGYPHIIRKSRTSVAILTGNESTEELEALGHDIFSYFGMGCRSVTKLYVPEDYALDTFFEGIFAFGEIAQHNKYANNYDYYKALWLLNGEKLLDNNFVLLKESKELSSPLGSLFYERYKNLEELHQQLERRAEEIQCTVGAGGLGFGTGQQPELWDYADNVDTPAWLRSLS